MGDATVDLRGPLTLDEAMQDAMRLARMDCHARGHEFMAGDATSAALRVVARYGAATASVEASDNPRVATLATMSRLRLAVGDNRRRVEHLLARDDLAEPVRAELRAMHAALSVPRAETLVDRQDTGRGNYSARTSAERGPQDTRYTRTRSPHVEES